jgi:hypothetical protein
MNNYIKHHGTNAQQDWLRLNYFYKLSLEKKSFLFPQPLECSNNYIVYKKLENILPLPESLTKENCYDIMYKTGKALADIHSVNSKSDEVILHSDFGLINIAWDPLKKIPIIFDPVLRNVYWYKSYSGSRYNDICQLVNSIFTFNFFIIIIKISPVLPAIMTKAFIKGYEQNSGISLSNQKLVRYAKKRHQKYYRNRIAVTKDLRYLIAFPFILLLRLIMMKALRCR